MRIIKGVSSMFSKLIGKQEIVATTSYRPITFLIFADDDSTTLVYNTYTNMLVRLNETEVDVLSGKVPVDVEQHKELIENWFLVPLDNDDYDLCEQTRVLFKFVTSIGKPKYNSYTILTTTDCNARCFYCYQFGRDNSRAHMSVQTANDVAQFIISNSDPKQLTRITWFGGEPLYNDGVIDIICNRLNESGMRFVSSMISNGYLLSKDVVDRAVNKWNLKSVQIPIDGTEEVYNRCKAYIYDDPSPYKRVIGNIKTALDSGIKVVARVNVDNHNVGDIFLLAKELASYFSSYEKFHIYSHVLYENAGAKLIQRDDWERMKLADNLIAFEEYCNSLGIFSSRSIPSVFRTVACAADNPNAVSIGPDGRLGLCSHVMSTDILGSIYSKDEDVALIDSWQKYINCKELCKNCPFLPLCLRVKNCSEKGSIPCDASYRKLKMHHFKEAMLKEHREKAE